MTRPRILLLDGVYRLEFYAELQQAFDAEWLLRLPAASERDPASAIDLAVVCLETVSRTTISLCQLIEKGVPTLHIADGISEWRFIWENDEPGQPSLPRFQPILCHKVACIGRSQARLFESFGNHGKCEVVGLPRLDPLRGRRPRQRKPGTPPRLLIVTARAPGFTESQLQRVEQSLRDIMTWIKRAVASGGFELEAAWAVTCGLDARLGVEREYTDQSGRELARVLEDVDAVVSTPSTAMLEGMLQGVPVALLDYNNCPHYVPAAWSITSPEHLDDVIPELFSPPAAKMQYQQAVLDDALECRTPAMPRLVKLIEEMIRTVQECRKAGRPLAFPEGILVDSPPGRQRLEGPDFGALSADQPVLDARDRRALQLEIGHLRLQHELDEREIDKLKKRLAARDPVSWLRALFRATPLPPRLRHFLSDQYRRIRRRTA